MNTNKSYQALSANRALASLSDGPNALNAGLRIGLWSLISLLAGSMAYAQIALLVNNSPDSSTELMSYLLLACSALLLAISLHLCLVWLLFLIATAAPLPAASRKVAVRLLKVLAPKLAKKATTLALVTSAGFTFAISGASAANEADEFKVVTSLVATESLASEMQNRDIETEGSTKQESINRLMQQGLPLTGYQAPAEQTAQVVNQSYTKITVQPGDNLWMLSAEHLGTDNAEQILDFITQIQALNPEITDPNLIYPGQDLQLPEKQIVKTNS